MRDLNGIVSVMGALRGGVMSVSLCVYLSPEAYMQTSSAWDTSFKVKVHCLVGSSVWLIPRSLVRYVA